MEKKKRVLLVTQYFYPENFKSNDIAFELQKRGFQVDALVGIPNYPEGKYYKGYGIFKKRIETINGVRVYRAFQTPRGRKASGLGLSINYLTYTFFASIWALFFVIFKKKYDSIIVHQTSPITQALPAILISKIRRTPIYTWVLDIWPDSIILGAGIKNKKILSAISKIVKFVYDNSTKILISSEQFRDLILNHGLYNDKIEYFPNWSDDFLKMPINDIPKLPDGFLILMAGNLGVAQNIDNILNSANILRDEKNIKWVFVGDGSKKIFIDDYIQQNNLQETVFTLGRYPLDYMPAFFEKANAMLLSLKADFPHIKAVVPSRLQSYMSASRPILAMVEGGAAEIINESNCGYVVHPDDYLSLVEIIKSKMLPNIEEFEKLGENGRNYYENHFTKEKCIDNLIKIIELNN